MTVPFIGLNDLGDLLGADVSTSDLAVISIDSACEMVRGYIDNPINLVEDDEIVLDGTGTYRLTLPFPPVRSVLEIDLYEEDDIVEETDWVLELAGIIRRVDAVWSRGRGNVTVVYTHGWDVEETEGGLRVPSDIRRVALEIAGRMYSGAAAVSGGTAGIVERQLGNYQERFAEAVAVIAVIDILPSEMMVLNRYRTSSLGASYRRVVTSS